MENIEKTPNHNLKCSVCKNYLNVAPVLTSEDGKISKCGRCQLKGPPLSNRNSLYEAIGAKLSFPCVNEECKERMAWNDVRKHEKSCKYRKINCPFWNCREKDINFNISADISHFESSHPGSIHMNDVSLNLATVLHLQSFMKLLVVNDLPFFIIIHCLKFGETILFGIFNFDNKSYDYEIKITSDKHLRRLVILKEKVLLYDEDQHCLYCLQNLCQMESHKFSKRYPDNQKDKYKFFSKIDQLCIKNVLETDSILFDINITENEEGKNQRN